MRDPARPAHARRIVVAVVPAALSTVAALAGLSGWTLAAIAALAVALTLLVDSLTTEPDPAPAPREKEDALRALGESLGLPAPAAGEPADNPRWARAAADRARALRASASIRQSVFDSTDAPVFATSSSGSILACNRAAAEFLERAPEQIAGRELGDFFSQAELLELHAAARSAGVLRTQLRIAKNGAARTFQAIAAAARPEFEGPWGDEPVVVITLRDVTELARAVQLKTDFVANASHELRTPLASIRGAVETLQDMGDEDPPMRNRLVAMIAANAERLEDLTRDLLDLSRLESPDAPPEIGPVDLADLVRSVASLLEPAASRRRITIQPDIAPDIARIHSDRRLLTVILRNLAENAVKFAYEDTTVRIVAEALAPPAHDAPPSLRIRVIDRGIGIPLAQQQRIFERFYQGDPARTGDSQSRGTGLGLAIVKHAVRTLGGTVSVESVWKEGTTMTVELPGHPAP